ncbi:MAG: class II aldolase/adducin family protein [Proteobacteria bacterium]|nr:class II aldolase/adducin family protein [Pseudomonadota bacterium]
MPEVDAELSEKLALSCNILAMGGHGNLTMGHVTARKPGQTYLHMNPHDLGLEEITSQDIIIIDFEGTKLVGSGRRHSEYPIHTEIYKMYPHINCVIHTHPFYSIVVGATEGTIRTISHEGSLFAGIPLFVETALLIRTPELGEAVARCLNGHRALLMRNHGVVLTGASIEEATIYAVLLERAARLQVTASQVGKLTSSTPSEIEGKGEQVFYPKNINNFWEYLVRKLRKNGASGL